jgi:uncharacterized protein (DUF1778 family)
MPSVKINIRATREMVDRIDAAAKSDGLTRSAFLLSASVRRAREILSRGCGESQAELTDCSDGI